MNITIMNRRDAVRYCNKEHSERVIIISISDPYIIYTSKPHRGKGNGVLDVLRLSFADADRVSEPDVYGRVVGEPDMMSDDDAKKLWSFSRSIQTQTLSSTVMLEFPVHLALLRRL